MQSRHRLSKAKYYPNSQKQLHHIIATAMISSWQATA